MVLDWLEKHQETGVVYSMRISLVIVGTFLLVSCRAFQPPLYPQRRHGLLLSCAQKGGQQPPSPEGEAVWEGGVAWGSRRAVSTRREVLRPVAGALGGVLLASLFTPNQAALASRKSPKEVQFELFKMGLDLTRAFNFEGAEKVYSEVILRAGDPMYLSERDRQMVARAYSNRGNVRSMLDRMEEALVDYSKAVELAPDMSEFWLNRGLAYETIADTLHSVRPNDAMQFYDAAIGDYEHAIVLEPSNHRLYLNAGDVLTHLQRHDEALENYRRALDLFPISPASRGKVALMEVQLGNVEKGTFLVESIVKRNPDYNEMVLASAAIGWNLGRFAEGMDLYNHAVEKDPRLLDDKYLTMSLHWPPTMLSMVQRLREAGTISGPRAQAVRWFDEGGRNEI